MKQEAASRAGALVRRCKVAALGTLHEGAPSVTMGPYALVVDPLAFIVLVSALSAHTRDMLAHPHVGLMMMEPERADTPAHALPRVSIQGEARSLLSGSGRYDAARTAYESRFPDMSMLFGLADFSLFAIEPAAVRVVTGFAQAASVGAEALARAVAGPH